MLLIKAAKNNLKTYCHVFRSERVCLFDTGLNRVSATDRTSVAKHKMDYTPSN